ncbi:MAG: class I lanthipeptide [Cytophagaceae bacterium]|nr:class I lanthipeptide [Cytophagaceae bacterium]
MKKLILNKEDVANLNDHELSP